MKRNVLYNLALLPLAMMIATFGMSQTILADNQNPNYMVSQARYTQLADSINQWHGTTPQETYKAIDYLADKREAREKQRAFRRELRLERARNGYYYNDYGYDYYPYYNNYNFNYNRPYFGYRTGLNRYYNTAASVAIAASLAWWWCR